MIHSLRQITNNTETVLIDERWFFEGVADDMLYEAVTEKKKPTEKPKQDKSKKLLHLDHAEDLIVRHGRDGMAKVLDTLGKTHEFLKGGRPKDFNLSTKFDGSPSIVWGTDPQTKQFFVGTKSTFNKNPKVNYTPKDIDTNHGTSPGLVAKLKLALKHLKNVSPKQGIFQGDLMYGDGDVSTDNTHHSFTPNTITYRVPKNSVEGKKVEDSKLGIVAHTHYQPAYDGDLHANFGVDMSKFKPHKDVHFMDPSVGGAHNYKPSHQREFASNISKAQEIHNRMDKNGAYDIIKDHAPTLLAYINHGVKNKRTPSTAGYISYLSQQFNQKMSAVKLDKTKKRIKDGLDQELLNVTLNKNHFENLFKTHKHIQDAKNTLVNVLSSKSPYDEQILGNKSKPEGFVASHKGDAVKLVDRDHFSASNFDWNEKVNPSDNPTVLSWGRFNPPTVGHEKMLKMGGDVARRIGAKHVTIASRTQGGEKDPLSPQEKMKWMKAMFPGKDISIAGENDHTLIAQLQHLHNSGVKDLTIVAGADRVKNYTDILAKYNGHGKLFHFKRARIVSSGERNPESEGTDGVSASKLRAAAKSGDYDTFKKGIPKHIKDNKAAEMFDTLRAEMTKPKPKVKVHDMGYKK